MRHRFAKPRNFDIEAGVKGGEWPWKSEWYLFIGKPGRLAKNYYCHRKISAEVPASTHMQSITGGH